MPNILIKKPEIISVNNERSRLVTEYVKDGKVNKIWVESEKKYEKYMVTENCDAALCYIFVMSVRRGYDIICESPVTEMLLQKLNEFSQCAATYRLTLYVPKITAVCCDSIPNEGAVVTTCSLGVDSIFSIEKFINPPYPSLKLTHLMHNDVLQFVEFRRIYIKSLKKTKEEAMAASVKVKENVRKDVIEVSNKLGVEPLFFETSIFPDPYCAPIAPYLTFLNSGYIAFSFAKLFGTVIVPGALDLSHFRVNEIFAVDNTYHEVLNLFTLTTANPKGGIQFIPDTFCKDRLDKIRDIIDSQIAQKYLSVCFFTLDGKNCNVCSKCKRTLVLLDYLGVLERFSNVFNIDYYNKNFDVYKKYLIDGRDIKKILQINEIRYREIRDTVIAKHR